MVQRFGPFRSPEITGRRYSLATYCDDQPAVIDAQSSWAMASTLRWTDER
jgi:hypothetical protein